MTLVKWGIKDMKNKKGKSKCLWNREVFFLVPAKVFWVTWQCPVTPIQLSTSGRVDTAAAGHWLLPIWDTQVPGDGYSYQHTWNFDRTQYLCVDNFAPLWASFDSFPQLSGSWKEVRGTPVRNPQCLFEAREKASWWKKQSEAWSFPKE